MSSTASSRTFASVLALLGVLLAGCGQEPVPNPTTPAPAPSPIDSKLLFHDDFDSRFQATPYFGFHVFSDPNFFVSARGGYRMVPSDMERVGGMHAGANLNFSVW